MKKSDVVDLLVKHQIGVVEDLKGAVLSKRHAKDIDEEDTIDKEDLSHQTVHSEMEIRLKGQLTKAQNYLDLLEEVGGIEAETVQVGAFVQTDQMDFLIAIPTTAIKVQGHTIMGISVKAPIYYQMLGKNVGDTFKSGNITYQITKIT